MLPLSTQDGQGASFLDALFTSVSAVCVTGLVVHDTATYWSVFGQVVILALIQIGGMGVITVAVAVASASGRQISLKQISTMQEAISAHMMDGIVNLTGFTIKMTIAFEAVGAAAMAPVFCKEFGFFKGLWYAVFHSISAFCNAGFDLMGIRSQYSSMTHFIGNPVINVTIIALIIVGGIGFLTWDDIRVNGRNVRRYHMQTKVIITTTALLVTLPAIYFFIFEFKDGSLVERILSSLFQSVTTRTAGFNTADLTLISETGIMLMIVLMIVGGSPGSTAGGIKTTTLAVMISTSLSVFRRRAHTHFFGRRISEDTVRNAASILVMYLTLFLMGGCVISSVEKLPLLTCLYESASAIGTVGLTIGITPQLGVLSKLILITLMYVGRVGGLTVIFSTISAKNGNTARFPQEKMTVG